MTRRTRVLAVTHDFSRTGAPIFLLNLLTALSDRYEFVVVGSDFGMGDGLMEDYIKLGITPLLIPDLWAMSHERAIDDWYRLMKSFDVVMCNSLISYRAVIGAASHPKPTLWTLHESDDYTPFFNSNAPWSKLAFGCASGIIATCEYARKIYEGWFPRNYKVIMPGVPMWLENPFKETPLEGPLKILMLGTISPRKGQDVALDALSQLGSKCEMDLVGRTADHGFEKMLRARHTGLPVTWHGELPNDGVTELMKRCDVVVVASRDELTCQIVAEAQMMGRCVVASNVGGIPECIESGKTGMLFKGGDASDLAGVLRMMEQERPMIDRLARAGREYASINRSLQNVTFQYSNLIEMACEKFYAKDFKESK